MRFLQKSAFSKEILCVTSFCLLGSILFMIYDRRLVPVLLCPAVLMGAVMVFHLATQKEYIIINEEGITCEKDEETVWCYQWSEIAQLKFSARFRNPTVEIILKQEMHEGNLRNTELYFQYGRVAKQALARYAPDILLKR